MKNVVSIFLSLILVSILSINVFAAVSPVAPIEKEFKGGNVTVLRDSKNPLQVTFSVTEKAGYKFNGWDIGGDYEIVGGSLKSKRITVVFKNGTIIDNIEFNPLFKKNDNIINQTNKIPIKNESPKTGDSISIYLLLILCNAMFFFSIAENSSSKNNKK